jgi:Cu-processing system permease protein
LRNMFLIAGNEIQESLRAGALTGMSGLAKSVSLGPPALVAALVLWMLGPLALAAAVFSRREL